MEIFLGLAALAAILYYGYLKFFKTDTTDLKEPAVVPETKPEPVAEKAPEPVAETKPEPVAETKPEPAPVTSVLDVNKDGKVSLIKKVDEMPNNAARQIQMNFFEPPAEKAYGGMIERQPTDNRRYL